MRHPAPVAIAGSICISLAVLVGVQAQAPAPSEQKASPPAASAGPAGGLAGIRGGGNLPQDLDGLVAAALRANPEVLQAEAKLRKAEADLNQARLKATRDVVTAFEDMKRLEELLGSAEMGYAEQRRRTETGTAPVSEEREARRALIEAKAAIDRAKAAIRYLIGIGGEARTDTGDAGQQEPSSGSLGARRSGKASIAPRVRELLEKKVSIRFENAIAPAAIDQLKSKFFPDEVLILETYFGKSATIDLKDVPLRTVLLALGDLLDLTFVFRDYGILVTTREKAATIDAPSIP